jgi:hypothetical protein
MVYILLCISATGWINKNIEINTLVTKEGGALH